MAIETIREVGVVQLDELNRVQVALSDVNGTLKLNVRQWFLSDVDSEWRPTKQGFMLSLEQGYDLGKLLADFEYES